MANEVDTRGLYSIDYFTSAQAAVYIGDVWVDEITSISYSVSQNRQPIYGYADQLFRDVSKGQRLVQGQFSINFKEAGYLFLILDRYRKTIRGKESLMINTGQPHEVSPFLASDITTQFNVERIVNGEINLVTRNRVMGELAALLAESRRAKAGSKERADLVARRRGEASGFISSTGPTPGASLGGFASEERMDGRMGAAENLFEAFEDKVWGKDQKYLDNDARSADDHRLNPFDMYVTFGDYAGDNSANHTVHKLSEVHILGSGRATSVDDPHPVQEIYTFIARNLV